METVTVRVAVMSGNVLLDLREVVVAKVQAAIAFAIAKEIDLYMDEFDLRIVPLDLVPVEFKVTIK